MNMRKVQQATRKSKATSSKGVTKEPRGQEPLAKRWCFTLNNPKEDEGIPTDLVTYMIVGDEVCPTTGTPHFQGYVEFKLGKRLTALKKLLQRAHWEKASGTGWENYIYCSKDKQFKECGERPKETRSSQRKTKSDHENEDYALALQAPSVREGLDVVRSKRPRDFCLHGEAIERNLKRAKSQKFIPLFTLDKFVHPPLILTKPVLLWGSSNTGKTQFALAHFKNPLVVRHIDKLKSLGPDNDGIIFDDMSFRHWPKESIIHLLDSEVESEINVRYGTVTISANTPKIFTHNTLNPFYVDEEIAPEQKRAIERRFQRIEVLNKLYV